MNTLQKHVVSQQTSCLCRHFFRLPSKGSMIHIQVLWHECVAVWFICEYLNPGLLQNLTVQDVSNFKNSIYKQVSAWIIKPSRLHH